MNKYACEYELQTISEMFPAMKPEEILDADDTFFTKHLLSRSEKLNFEEKYNELLSRRK